MSPTISTKIEQWQIERLVEYARNPRKNDHVVDKIVASIKEFGFVIPILAKSDGTVIDGHLRLKGARKLKLKEVPVIVCDHWTDEQVKAFRILANKSANWADWDNELLTLEFSELKDAGFDLNLTGFTLDEIGKIEIDLGGDKPNNDKQAAEGEAPVDAPNSIIGVIVECSDEQEQLTLLEEFNGRGLKCRALI